MVKTAVVILNWNGQDYLKRFLPTLILHSSEAKIIVADNASTDDSLAVLENFPEVEVLKLSENYGYAGGYNEALNQIEAEYFLLLNSDIEVTSNWLVPMVRFLDENPTYGAVQPKINDIYNKSHFEYAGAAGGFLDSLGYPFCRGRIFDTLEQDTGQYDSICDVFWATGACFMVRSEVFHALSGFDASFFAHMEEIDFCWRMRSQGYQLACVPQATVYHVGGGTLNKTSPRKTYLNFRNGLTLLIKNLPKNQLWWKLPFRIVLDLIAGIKFWNDQSFAHFKAVFTAHKDALSRWKTSIQNENRSTPSPRPTNSILTAYYLQGKKKYSDLSNTK
ncbi:glycosyltransferase family 2 protein [Marinoscillum furvescens]|uniref:GT2 family glycosyltransferase n=1 Tax=Marinoscillum furvescens DSM 4134 TaxID=1122208 RepID=A0A3D9L2M8_MARFU|nr:glycosyltransferase family 2 protein [Marinoscillum furvescens]RED97947.1 GT2 family glycosyltransferase [Marinoscillum furvescens DSM 4134]